MEHLPLFTAILFAASSNTAAQPTGSAAAAKEAEHFVTRHGYTASGHPEYQPVVSTSLYDMFYSQDELIARRRSLLNQNATCVRAHANGSHTVLFQSAKEPDEFWFVALNIGEQPYLGHQPVTRSADCVAVHGAVP